MLFPEGVEGCVEAVLKVLEIKAVAVPDVLIGLYGDTRPEAAESAGELGACAAEAGAGSKLRRQLRLR